MRAVDKITRGLRDAIAGRIARTTTFIVCDLKTARRYERQGHSYTWEMDGDRPTGRCIVRLRAESR